MGTRYEPTPGDRDVLHDLYEAIDNQDFGKVESILSRKHLDVNQSIEMYGMSLLHLAVGHECADIVKVLLEHKADPNSKAGDDGLSSLHLSVHTQNLDIFKLLLKAGGDLKMEDQNGLSCMDLFEEMEDDFRDDFLEAIVLDTAGSVSTSSKPSPTVACRKSRIMPRPSMFMSRRSLIPPRPNQFPAAPHPPATSISTSGNSTFYSCVSSTAGKENCVPGSSQIESLSTYSYSCVSSTPGKENCVPSSSETESLSVDLSRCNVSEMSTRRLSIPSFSCSAAEGISDQSTNPLMSDVTCSVLVPATMTIKSTTSTASIPMLLESSSSFDKTGTGPHCTSSADCSCCSSVAPTPVLSSTQMKTLRATAAANGLPCLPSTINVLSKFVNTETKSIMLSSPKTSSITGYSMELDYLIRNIDLLNQWQNHQVEFVQNFTTPKRTSKSFYNYLLLDPFVVKRTNFSGNYLRTGLLQNPEKFHIFIKSIFYIGKGSANRPLQHLVEAKNRLTTKENKKLPDTSKVDRVLDIWRRGQGVIVLSLFHHSAEVEANANEAAMIDSIGLGDSSQLTNIKKGSYLSTPAANWSQKVKNQFGSYLLHKAYCAFVVSGSNHKVFYPRDV